jgi:hypothetical protein
LIARQQRAWELRPAYSVIDQVTCAGLNLRGFIGTKKSELLNCISKLAKERLSANQRSLLFEILSLGEDISATRFVTIKCKEGKTSKSTLWGRLNSLKRIGLIDFGSRQLRNSSLKLTSVGRLLVWLL